MKRTLGTLAIIAALLAVAILAEVQLGNIPRQDPLGKELLYLPSPEMLRIISLGHPDLVADVLYLWSIQYYSLFEPQERFLYLETIYDLITDLDPLYFDAYRIGALIMQIPTGGDQEELKGAVQRLFDKGLRNLPDNWQIAEAAAWDFFMRFRDRQTALHYAEIAAQRPGAPPRIKRMVGVWRDGESVWTLDDSVQYWTHALEEAEDAMDRAVCMSKLYDAVTARDRARLQPALNAYGARFGGCANDWSDVVRVGLLREVPLDLVGNPYGIDPRLCRAVGLKKIKDQ
jgi:hypothetical protein